MLRLSKRLAYADSASTDGSVEFAERLGAIDPSASADGKLTAARGRNPAMRAKEAFSRLSVSSSSLTGVGHLNPSWVECRPEFSEETHLWPLSAGDGLRPIPMRRSIMVCATRNGIRPRGGKRMRRRCDGALRGFDQVGGYRAEPSGRRGARMTARMRAAGWKIWRIDTRMTETTPKSVASPMVAKNTAGRLWLRAVLRRETKTFPQPLYGKQFVAPFSGRILRPSLFCAAILCIKPLPPLALPLALRRQYGVSVRGDPRRNRWKLAGLILFRKIPEAIGAARFLLTRRPVDARI